MQMFAHILHTWIFFYERHLHDIQVFVDMKKNLNILHTINFLHYEF